MAAYLFGTHRETRMKEKKQFRTFLKEESNRRNPIGSRSWHYTSSIIANEKETTLEHNNHSAR